MSEIRSQATPARDELADIIHVHVCANNLEDCTRECHLAAAALEKDGWSKPRTVNNAAELDALPVGSVVREICETDFFGVLLIPGTFEKFPNGLGWHVVAGHGSREVPLPVTVLFTPGDAG
ncbi:hypothetical protein [Rhodococcus erythropolis]|uniref:hypothetical protein n=1 Tax=Rhodococcus erythropolis TaxID=1833 RepID=UPI001BE7965F|nr:hypothetical protein [Rhodococcus erythropolis]MBT2265897.1 hypothetical protein [Rhodococcus erythropolis]